jgi:poly-gamma-glutamate synthesis protein (capsule biosynthesis protein)
LVDGGADAVIGAHPHVLQGKEVYRGRPILYSAGNLVSPRPGATAVYLLRFEGKALKGISIVPVGISGGVARLIQGKTQVSRVRAIEGLDSLIPAPRAAR